MRFINTLSILLALGLSSRLSAMDEHDRYAFRCKIPVEREERSLPAGITASAVVAAPQVDPRVRAEKLAEIHNAYKGDWTDFKKLIRNAIEKYGIHPDEIDNVLRRYCSAICSPLLNKACKENDDAFKIYLVEKGIDFRELDGFCNPLSYVTSLSFAKFMVLRGMKTENAMLYNLLNLEPKLVFFYFNYGANIADTNPDGANGLIRVCREFLTGTLDQRIQAAQNLVGLGVSLDARIIEGSDAGCDYKQLLERSPKHAIPDSDKKKIREAIDEAIQKNTNARSQALPVITKELAHHFRSGPREIEDLVIAYLGHIIPDDILRQIDEVDREADQGLAQLLRADKGDEKSN